MAEKNSYPQLPSTVWWGVRNLLQKSPGMTLDERGIAIELGVQSAAARQYMAELRRVGILSDDGKATELGKAWRLDTSYGSAVEQLITSIYPDSLVQLSPPEDGDRQKVTSWFTHEGLGTGTAGNKAATYLLIGSPVPNEAPSRAASTSSSTAKKETRPSKRVEVKPSTQPPAPVNPGSQQRVDAIPLNINLQIHISADASGDQIESIFAAMRRYLYNDNAA
ncbi:MAG TPA: hypothetical protein VF459_12620 [Caulobacteraceae bacterium]